MINSKLPFILLFLTLVIPIHLFSQSIHVPKLGVCASIDKITTIKKHDYAFIQPTVNEILQPNTPDSLYHFASSVNSLPESIVCNVFIPGSIKTTGPDVNEGEVLKYAKRVFERAQKLNIQLIVFGSGASRMIPEGFDKNAARKQFVDISKKLARLAKEYNITLALESQNREECNFINTLRESIDIAKDVNHPNFKITADFYHMFRENDPPSDIIYGKKYIHHIDIGEKENRTAPGVKGDNFIPYFKALQQIGFKGMIALECRFNDLEKELPLAKETITKQWELARK